MSLGRITALRKEEGKIRHIQLDASLNPSNTNDSGTPEGVIGVGNADYYNTLTLDSIQLLDANLNQGDGVGYSTDSGTHSNLLGGHYSVVPVPSSFALFAASGLIGAVGCFKRRRTRNA